jgi:hypothetical protein
VQLAEVAQQRRLSDPRLAGDEDEPAAAVDAVGKGPLEGRERLPAFQQGRPGPVLGEHRSILIRSDGERKP